MRNFRSRRSRWGVPKFGRAAVMSAKIRCDVPIGADESRRLLECPNAALFLDIDGTLLDLAARPDAVLTPEGLVGTLARADSKLRGAVALVSGRTIEEIDGLFTPLRLRASGVHGAQIRFEPGGPTDIAPAAAELPPSLAAALNRALEAFPGILIENKGFSFAVHYRLNPRGAPYLRDALLGLLANDAWRGLEIEDAHYAFEVKPPSFDKGKAINRFLARKPFRGRTPVFVGDDTTDESGFAAVTARGGQAYAVGRPRSGASGFFESPRAVRDWLAAFAASEQSNDL
jgi:trehalose 6-phosphate phosphatase